MFHPITRVFSRMVQVMAQMFLDTVVVQRGLHEVLAQRFFDTGVV